MARLKQSVSWWCVEDKGYSSEALAKMIADIGYAGVEILEAKHWQLVKDHGLRIVSVGGHSSIENGLNRRENFPKIEKEIRENLEQAVKWDIPFLICFSGNRDGLDDESGAKVTAEHLSKLAEYAAGTGVTLCLELLNSKIDHPDYQCDKTAWGVNVCQMVDSSQVKLLYDIYHMQVMEGDVIHTIGDNHNYFAHYHTAGVPGRNEIDESQELYYPAIARAIHETGFDGYLGQEFLPVGDVRESLVRAFELCDVADA